MPGLDAIFSVGDLKEKIAEIKFLVERKKEERNIEKSAHSSRLEHETSYRLQRLLGPSNLRMEAAQQNVKLVEQLAKAHADTKREFEAVRALASGSNEGASGTSSSTISSTQLKSSNISDWLTEQALGLFVFQHPVF